MKSKQFDVYAAFYDLLYRDKDYKGEVAYIDKLIGKFHGKKKKNIKILDLACGTGRHLNELQKRGYLQLAGSDISVSMINIAKKNNKNIEFYNYSFQDANKITQKFDVIISMFSAVNYLTDFSSQKQAFSNVYNLLKERGIFIFDYWNGNAVVRDYSPVKKLEKRSGNRKIVRVSKTKLNMIKQDAFVNFRCSYFENDKKQKQFEENHHLHYYHFSEMSNLLESSGLKVLHSCTFMKANERIKPYDWNVSKVAIKYSPIIE